MGYFFRQQTHGSSTIVFLPSEGGGLIKYSTNIVSPKSDLRSENLALSLPRELKDTPAMTALWITNMIELKLTHDVCMKFRGSVVW